MKVVRRSVDEELGAPSPQFLLGKVVLDIAMEDDDLPFIKPPVPRLASKELYDSDYDF